MTLISPLYEKNEILEKQGLKMEKIFWHLTKEENKIFNLTVVSGGRSTIDRASIWPRSSLIQPFTLHAPNSIFSFLSCIVLRSMYRVGQKDLHPYFLIFRLFAKILN